MTGRPDGGEQPAENQRPPIVLVVAVSENGVIGRDGELPWRLPADLARFKRLTMGHAMLMGRKTYASIGRPLPGRVSVVLTRDPAYDPGHADVLVATDFAGAVVRAIHADVPSRDAVHVIGGGEVYRLALPHADRVELTRVHTTVEGDSTFPELDPADWRLTATERHEADEKNEHAFTFETWQRRDA